MLLFQIPDVENTNVENGRGPSKNPLELMDQVLVSYCFISHISSATPMSVARTITFAPLVDGIWGPEKPTHLGSLRR